MGDSSDSTNDQHPDVLMYDKCESTNDRYSDVVLGD